MNEFLGTEEEFDVKLLELHRERTINKKAINAENMREEIVIDYDDIFLTDDSKVEELEKVEVVDIVNKSRVVTMLMFGNQKPIKFAEWDNSKYQIHSEEELEMMRVERLLENSQLELCS